MGAFSVVQAVKQIPKKGSVFSREVGHVMSVARYGSNAVQACLCSNVLSFTPIGIAEWGNPTIADPDYPLLEIAICDLKKGISAFIKVFSEAASEYGQEDLFEKARIYLETIKSKYKYFTYDETEMYSMGSSNDTPEKFGTELRRTIRDFSIANNGFNKQFQKMLTKYGDISGLNFDDVEFMINDKEKRKMGWKTEQRILSPIKKLDAYLQRIN